MRIWIIAHGSRARPLGIVILLAVCAMLGPVPSMGSDAIPEVVKARQEAMKAMANAGKKIAGMFEGKLPYDAPAFKRWAETIKAHSGAALMAEFPAASFGPPSAAKYEIDPSRDEFDALARKVASFASVISAAADQAPDDITPQMRMGAGMSTIGSSLLGKRKVAAGEEDISKLPAEHAFHLMLQECSACHAKFREEIH
ncbi:cytochrome c [Phyllobacterium zundukense]|uniref:Cytochrome c n=1 Tax=Phyllobacterium zundukense TaxID=1867719 RepID=A0ACD4D5A3_9HYPH|nr:cytochrome c [Phyllobacterium zundukense]UXN60969.1 cytochrome c [Phyllobacterium zundukense]